VKGTLVVLVVLLALVATFAVQNPVMIPVQFFHWYGRTHLLVVIAAAFAAGVAAGWFAGLPGYLRRRAGTTAAHKRIQELEIEVAALKPKSTPPATPGQEGKR
jgi:uncharacterized membrane protein YciS (DUF1049 family)